MEFRLKNTIHSVLEELNYFISKTISDVFVTQLVNKNKASQAECCSEFLSDQLSAIMLIYY